MNFAIMRRRSRLPPPRELADGIRYHEHISLLMKQIAWAPFRGVEYYGAARAKQIMAASLGNTRFSLAKPDKAA